MSCKNVLKNSVILLSIIFLGLLLFSINPGDAQFYQYGYPYSQYGSIYSSYQQPYNMYNFGVGTNNIPITNPFMRTFISPENFYMPYGFGTNSSFNYLGTLSNPYSFGGYGGFGGLYGLGGFGGLYGLGGFGGLYGLGGFGGLYGLGGLGGFYGMNPFGLF